MSRALRSHAEMASFALPPCAPCRPRAARVCARRAVARAVAARPQERGSVPGSVVQVYDVVVVGGGPAGLSVAAALGARGCQVCCLDAAIDKPWPNHYGVWRDEFEPLGLEDCATATYPTTAVCVGGAREKTVLQRPYIRVDRVKLKTRLMERCVDSGVRIEKAFASDVDHVSPTFSTVSFNHVIDDDAAADSGPEEQVRARLVVDCTGHALRFTKSAVAPKYTEPWAQAAYGIEAEVESHPYQVDQMLLMDFRDDHMRAAGDETRAASSEERPTFLYVFPTSKTRAFFEETSVIAPTAVPFEELRERLYKRLEHDGVVIRRVIEEEFSLIPMGGSLPDQSQRVVGFGGAACLVHPATGYMVARTVSMAGSVADVIANGLKRIGNDKPVSEVSREVWDATWSLSLRRERDFLNFGAELLSELTMDESRRFFDAFFALPPRLWTGFLGFDMSEPVERMYFALYFFVIASNPIRMSLLRAMWSIGRWKLIRSVLPLALSRSDDGS